MYLLNKTLKLTKTLTASFITKRKTNNTDNKGRHQTRDRTDEHKIHIEKPWDFQSKPEQTQKKKQHFKEKQRCPQSQYRKEGRNFNHEKNKTQMEKRRIKGVSYEPMAMMSTTERILANCWVWPPLWLLTRWESTCFLLKTQLLKLNPSFPFPLLCMSATPINKLT